MCVCVCVSVCVLTLQLAEGVKLICLSIYSASLCSGGRTKRPHCGIQMKEGGRGAEGGWRGGSVGH